MKRRWRVRVAGTDAGRVAVVFVTPKRWSSWVSDGAVVAKVRLTEENADEKLAIARARAASYARQIQSLERNVL